ncbi:hypothetical protein [Streptomyces sp. Caat 7-52]|uniref:hypothetical protein n=1 Tax=Streptomyces sp. Caat 7-52 TaxID=2949637 RepID=UPI0020356D82|nr:hypothetical protein [Streptomyces sp. Caat 7-52]
MNRNPEPTQPPVIVCCDEGNDLLHFADISDRFHTEPISLTDLHHALADMHARFNKLARPECS